VPVQGVAEEYHAQPLARTLEKSQPHEEIQTKLSNNQEKAKYAES